MAAPLGKETSNEYYLVSMARKYYKNNNIHTAKAWIITAKSIFPDNFSIHYEAYQMAKESGSLKEAASCLEEMIRSFPHESTLWIELKKIADSLHAENTTPQSEFYSELFSSLSSEIQPQMLLAVAENCKDTIEHCKLMLLLLKRFPRRTLEYGMKLIETLLAAEKHFHLTSPINKFRKLLVCDVIPLLLNCTHLQVLPKQIFRLLQKCLEFYVMWVNQPASTTKEDSSGFMEDVGELSGDEIWDRLYSLFFQAGQRAEWEVADTFIPGLSSEAQWARVSSFLHKRPKLLHALATATPPASEQEGSHLEENPLLKQVFYCALVVFLRSIYNYGKIINPEWFSASTSPDSTYVLYEGIYSRPLPGEALDSTKAKKRKLEYEGQDSDVLLTVSRNAPPEISSKLPSSFFTAFKCWELLHSNYYFNKELGKITQPFHMDKWPWFQDFCINTYIYQGYYKDAVEQLRLLQVATTREVVKNKATLQLSSCYYALCNTKLACEHFLDVIAALPNAPSFNEPYLPEPLPRRPGRHLHFIAYRRSEILQHCVQLLIKCFREKSLLLAAGGSTGGTAGVGGLGEGSDNPLGHLLVLIQHDWPREEILFQQVLENIKAQKHFEYPLFFTYIITPDILEEVMHLTTNKGGGVTLDLLPSSTTQISKQRAVTRGANKGAKEDLRQAMEKQMSRWEENLDQLLVQFLTAERSLLLQHV